MASALAYCTLCILLCGLHGMVTASDDHKPIHLAYYVQEIRSGANATLLAAAGTGQGNLSAVAWGSFTMVDNYLKEGTNATSKLLGNLRGTAVVAAVGGVATGGFQVNSEHIYNSASKYNGSSLTIMGTILTSTPPWECIIPGGTGVFRGYTGYAIVEEVAAAAVPPLFVYSYDIHITHKG